MMQTIHNDEVETTFPNKPIIKLTERLRITPSPVHSDADIDYLVKSIAELWSQCALARVVA